MPGEIARCDAVGLMAHKMAEGLQPAVLRKSSEGRYRFNLIHISRLIELYDDPKTSGAANASAS